MNTNKELFEFAGSLHDELLGFDEYEWAKRIESAINISTLPGEILGQLRVEMRSLERDELFKKITEPASLRLAIEYLNTVLP